MFSDSSIGASKVPIFVYKQKDLTKNVEFFKVINYAIIEQTLKQFN